MPPRFETARFHISVGPAALFDRVRFVMRNKKDLKIHAKHFLERVADRDAPLKLFRSFDSDKWELMTAEVRKDTGKFISSTWKVRIGQKLWWVTIGLHDTIVTVVDADERKRGVGEAIVKGGDLYEFVAQENRKLMLQDISQSG